MAIKKQHDSKEGDLPDAANDWLHQFLKHLELFLVETGQHLKSDSEAADYRVVALRAVKLTFLESGMTEEDIRSLFGRVAIENPSASQQQEWNPALNARRFELIDRDIQGTLSPTEQIELAGLTSLMREHLDCETNLPIEGARTLHRQLTEKSSDSADTEK